MCTSDKGAMYNIVLILCSKHCTCSVQLLRSRRGDGAAVWTLWTTLPTVSMSFPAISFSQGPLRSTWLESDLQQTPTLSKLSRPGHRHDTNFFCATIQTLLPQWDKCLYYGDNVEVWCVPSATHVPYIHQVIGFRVFVEWFQASATV
jgi:hypothetical protein